VERLLLHLVIWLLKKLLQVVVWAVTGTWRRFGSDSQGQQQAPKQPPGARKKTKAVIAQERMFELLRSPALGDHKRRRIVETLKRAGVPVPEAAFPFAFEPERVEYEPSSEDAAMAFEDARAAKRARARAMQKLRVPAVPAGKRSIRAALRDKATVRQALVLEAALGPKRSG